ncbi:unnamed protein product, partial [Vitis vinifera]|uniref:Uncharacterized protein n=1 Tax=Vitis vinifera TaxID=29760 RepID=D7SHG5_VITVI
MRYCSFSIMKFADIIIILSRIDIIMGEVDC